MIEHVSPFRGPVFIVGCDRSGTTLVRLMLARSPSLHIPPETGFIPELAEDASAYGDFTEPRERWFFLRDLQRTKATSKTVAIDAFELTLDEAEHTLAEAAPTDYAGAIDALFRASAARYGKSRWGDKTPRYVLHVRRLASLFPSSRFVHVIRDPRAVAASIRKAGWTRGFGAAARYWVERVDAGRAGGADLGPARYREIRYEAFVSNPFQELRSLAAWLCIDFVPDMLTFYKAGLSAVPPAHRELFPLLASPVEPAQADRWRGQLTRDEIADIEAIAGVTMDVLGYERTGACLSMRLRTLRACAGTSRTLARRARTLARRLGYAAEED